MLFLFAILCDGSDLHKISHNWSFETRVPHRRRVKRVEGYDPFSRENVVGFVSADMKPVSNQSFKGQPVEYHYNMLRKFLLQHFHNYSTFTFCHSAPFQVRFRFPYPTGSFFCSIFDTDTDPAAYHDTGGPSSIRSFLAHRNTNMTFQFLNSEIGFMGCKSTFTVCE